MSESIDRRVVEMRFDNKEFDKNVSTTMTVLEKLKEKLSFKGAGENFESTSGLSSAIDGVKNRFSALEIIGTTALVNLTNSAMNLGKQMAKSLTIDQVKAGFSEYELKMGSIQTIMASTGADIDLVNQKLNELNTYSDRTIYSFSDMTSNIGKFTNAGVGLDDAVNAMKGISNEAALAGANAGEASRAMYNFSQALSAGFVMNRDWMSIENANMATKGFKQQLIDTAVAMGTLTKTEEGYVSTTTNANGQVSEAFDSVSKFRDSLQSQWLTTDVLTQTLNNYSVDLENMSDKEVDAWRKKMKTIGYTDEQIAGIEKLSKQAYAAAQDVKTFSQLVDTVKESIGSGWAQTFENIFGNLEEAKQLWTGVNNVISDFVSRSADARNALLKAWHDSPRGRDAMITGFQNLYKAVSAIVKPIHEAFRDVFPPTTVNQLLNFSTRFRALTSHMIISAETAEKIKNVFTVLFSVLKTGTNIVGSIFKIFASLVKVLLPIGSTGLTILDGVSQGLSKMASAADSVTGKLRELTQGLLGKAISGLGQLFSLIGKGLSHLDLGKIIGLLAGGGLVGVIMKVYKAVTLVSDKLQNLFGEDGEGKGGIKEGIQNVLDGLSESLNTFQASLKVGQLATIAISIGILAAACSTLADIPVNKLVAAVGAVGGLFGELAGASHLMKGAETKGIIAMAGAIVILARAVKTLSEVDSLGKGLGGVAALLGELVVFMKLLSSKYVKTTAPRIEAIAKSMILIGIAMNLLAKPVKELGGMKLADLGKGLLGVAGTLAILLGFFRLLNSKTIKSSAKSINEAAGSMVLIGVALNLLVRPIKQMGAMDFNSLAKGLGGMGFALLELVGFTAVMSKIAAGSGNIMKASAALLVMSVGIKIMASAINQMSSTADAGKGLSVMFSSLLILGAAMAAMQNSLAGAAAMIVVAGALAIMAPAIALLSSLDIKGVGVGLLALAGTLTVFGVGSMLLAPVIPIMIALAAAMALLGVGVLSLGAGMTLLVGAFAMATGPIVEGATAISQAFPIIAKGIGTGIVTIIKTIGDSAEAIKDSFIKIMDAALSAFTDVIPKLVDTGLQMVMALLQGIDEHIGDITTRAISIIVNFVNALSEGLPQLTESGMNLMISFLNSMADTIAANGNKLTNAITNVILSVLETLVSLIPGFGKPAADAIERYRQGLADGEDDVVDEAAYISSETNDNLEIPDQYDNGYNAIAGLNDGMSSMLSTIRTTANTIANIVDETIRKQNQIKSPSRRLMRTGSYMMQGLIKGLDSLTGEYEKKADNIATVMISSANRSVKGITDAMNTELASGFNLNGSFARAMNVNFAMDGIANQNSELADKLNRLTDSLDGMTDIMNSRQQNNYITIDGSSDPDAFADSLTRRFKLNARTV